MADMCPSCGFNLANDVEIVDGCWRVHPRDGAFWTGQRLNFLSPPQLGILHTLAKASGRCVSVQALGNRHSDGEDIDNIIRVQVRRIRVGLQSEGIGEPFQTVRGFGYRWTGAAA